MPMPWETSAVFRQIKRSTMDTSTAGKVEIKRITWSLRTAFEVFNLLWARVERDERGVTAELG